MVKVYMGDPAIPIVKRNESAAMRFSSYIRNSRTTTVYQGQPTRLSVRHITFTTAELFFSYIGTPLYYEISLADGAGTRTFQVDHSIFSAMGFVKLELLSPSNKYDVGVVAHYVSDDNYKGNQTISFGTKLAQGQVQEITVTDPTNKTYIVDNVSLFTTSFDISFAPLRDNVDYEVIIKSGNFIQTPIRITYGQPTSVRITGLPYDTGFDISVNSIYGDTNNKYIYSKKITHQTRNESGNIKLSIAAIGNKFIDLSYTEVTDQNAIYSLYIENQLSQEHTEFRGVFAVKNLSYGTSYGNIYTSVTYPKSGNEYKYVSSDSVLSITTLNEDNSHILKLQDNIENTQIKLEYTAPIGEWTYLYFKKNGSLFGEKMSYSASPDSSMVFQNLDINTMYELSVVTEYTNSVYTETEQFTTLNEGPITNYTLSTPDINTTILIFTASPNAANISSVTYTYSSGGGTPSSKTKTIQSNTEMIKFGNDTAPDLTTGANSVLTPGTSYTITIETIYITNNRYSYVSNEFTTVNDLGKYTEDSSLNITDVTGDTIELSLTNGNYYYKHEITYTEGTESRPITLTTENWEKYRIRKLKKNTPYKINVKSFISDISYKFGVLTKTTKNEGPIDISHIRVSASSAVVYWNYGVEDISHVALEGDIVVLKDGPDFIYSLSELTHNKDYTYSYETVYRNNNKYITDLSFTTLNENNPICKTNTYFNTTFSGNTTIIEAVNTNEQNVSDTIINISGGTAYHTTILDFSMIKQYEKYSGNVVTTYKDNPNSGKLSYSTRKYVTDFSFSATMYKPMYTVTSDSILMDWYDNIPTAVKSYSVGFDGLTTSNISQKSIHFGDLSANSSYDVFLKRIFINALVPPSTNSQTIWTLNQGKAEITDNSCIIEKGGKTAVFDISNINQNDVSYTSLNIRRSDYTGNYTVYKSDTTVFDVDVSTGVPYDFYVTTRYNQVVSSLLNVRFISGYYTSDSSSFTPTISHEYEKSNVGKWEDLETYWTKKSVIISPNQKTGGIRTKYLEVISESQSNIILFKTEDRSSVASFKRQIDYLLKDYYTISYYVANHVPEGFPFSYRQAAGEIEYQLKISSNSSGVVLWETSPLVSTDISWNKVEINVYLPSSTKDATFSFERSLFEFNNLYVSDISFVRKNYREDIIYEIYTNNTSSWYLPFPVHSETWKDIMPADGESITRKVFTLSTNMSVEFWLYVHALPDDQVNKEIFSLGSVSHAISIIGNTLFIQNNRINFIQKENALTKKIPVHFLITYDHKKVSLYRNGALDISFCSTVYLAEAKGTDEIKIGTPFTGKLGYIIQDIKLKTFISVGEDFSSSYASTYQSYSSIGNYTEISGNVMMNLNVINKLDSLYHREVTVDFSLNNQKTLSKTITTCDLSFSQPAFVNQTCTLPSSFTLAFWGNSLSDGNILDFRGEDGTSFLKLVVSEKSIYTNINTTLKIPMNDELRHFSWTYNGVTGDSVSYLNGYMYDLSRNNTRETMAVGSVLRMNNVMSGSIGEFQIFDKILSQSEILTAYYNHYNLDYIYDLSGIYRVKLHVPLGSGQDPVSYKISGNTYNLNKVKGNIITQQGGNIFIDISMNPQDLNHFNQGNNSSFDFTLSDYNITTKVRPKPNTNPFISVKLGNEPDPRSTSASISIDESTTVNLTLNHVNTDIFYPYVINGIENSQVQGNLLTGNIKGGTPLTIKMREDYKTQGINPNDMVFSIGDLGLAVTMKLNDTTKNALTTNKAYVKEGDTFVISYEIPVNDIGTDFSFVVQSGGPYVTPDVGSGGVFSRTGLANTIDLSFKVVTKETSKKFTMKMRDNDSNVTVIVNDIPSPTLDISGVLINYQVKENQFVDLIIKTPYSWEDTRRVSFYIDKTKKGMTKEDISLNADFENEGSYNPTDMTGWFIIKSQRAVMRFNILPNKLYSEGTETLKFVLYDDPEYSDISASIVVIDEVKPPSYSWSITDLLDNTISQINEGGTFKFSLTTSGVNKGEDISYNITGITRDSLSGIDTLLSGVFKVDDNMSRVITIGKDLTTNGNKTFVISTDIRDSLVLDQYASIVINDTSQSPEISLSSTVDRPKKDGYFSVILAITNYDLLTDVQKGEQMHYYLSTGGESSDTKTDLTATASEGILILRNGVYSTTTSSMNHTFSFLCKTPEQKNFTFLLGGAGGQSLTVRLNRD